MNVENTSTEGVTDIKVEIKEENESDDEAESETDLYTDHVIKEEMVIGPVVIQPVVYTAYCREDLPVPKKLKLETIDEETDQMKPEKEMKEDTRSTDGIISNVDLNKNSSTNNDRITYYNLRKRKQKPQIQIPDVMDIFMCNTCDVPVPKNPKLETTDEETDQVKPEKGMKEDNTEGLISSVEVDKNSSTNIKTKTTLRNNKQTNYCNLRKHDQTPKISGKVLVCNDCGKKIRNEYTLAQHIVCHQKIRQDNNLKCKESTYQTKSQELHDKDRSFECDLCGYRSQEKYKLLKHLKLKHFPLKYVSKEKRLSCSVCEYRCTYKPDLTRHLRKHTGEKPFSCSHCDYKCNYKSSITKHERRHTGEEPYSCSHCDYKCNQKSHLSNHLRTHTGEKPYSCSHCDYKCNHKGNLLKHLRTHAGDKPYSCSHCDYKCKLKAHLSVHLRIHTGVKPYSCSHCGYKFSNKSHLSSHLRIHTGEKPYSCFHCDYKCNQKSSLSRHVRIHTGEKPYSCSHCDYKCNQKNHLSRHLLRHTKKVKKG